MPIRTGSRGATLFGRNYSPYTYIDWFSPDQEAIAIAGGDAVSVPAQGFTAAETAALKSLVSGAGKISKPGRRVCVVGHSILADALTSTGIWSPWGWVTWARRYLGRSVEFPAAGMFAVGGKTLPEIISEQMAPASAYSASLALVDPWQNSIGAMTAEQLIAGGKQLVDALAASGKTVVLLCARPTRGVYARNAADKKKVATLNRWIVEYAAANTWLFAYDPSDIYTDFSSGDALSGFLRDDLHDSQNSARLMGKAFADFLSPFLPAYPDAATNLGDVYDAATNIEGNLLPNAGLLTGTGGATLNGASGTVPTGWRGARSTAGATHTAVFSVGTDSVRTTLPTATMTIGGTGDSNSAFLGCEQDLTASVAPGDVIQAEIEIALAVTSTAFRGVAMQLVCLNSSYASLGDVWDGYVNTTQGNLGAVTTSFLLRTNTLAVPAGTKYITVQIFGFCDTSGTPAAAITFKRAALRKVI